MYAFTKHEMCICYYGNGCSPTCICDGYWWICRGGGSADDDTLEFDANNVPIRPSTCPEENWAAGVPGESGKSYTMKIGSMCMYSTCYGITAASRAENVEPRCVAGGWGNGPGSSTDYSFDGTYAGIEPQTAFDDSVPCGGGPAFAASGKTCCPNWRGEDDENPPSSILEGLNYKSVFNPLKDCSVCNGECKYAAGSSGYFSPIFGCGYYGTSPSRLPDDFDPIAAGWGYQNQLDNGWIVEAADWTGGGG